MRGRRAWTARAGPIVPSTPADPCALLRGPIIVHTMHLAARALSISGSATLELTGKVAELRRQGVDVISLGAGEPNFPSPPAALEAAAA